jgi:hypothetical protein
VRGGNSDSRTGAGGQRLQRKEIRPEAMARAGMSEGESARVDGGLLRFNCVGLLLLLLLRS